MKQRTKLRAKSGSKSGSKSVTKLAAKPSVNVRVMIANQPRPKRKTQKTWKTKVGIASVMAVAIGSVVGGIGLAIQLMVNPGAGAWLRWIIPGWEYLPLTGNLPQSLNEIRANANNAGLQVGNPIYLSTYPGFTKRAIGFDDFLLPIYKPQSHCSNGTVETGTAANGTIPIDCQQLVELRVYRPQSTAMQLPGRGTGLELLDQINIKGMEELTAIAPLINASIVKSGSSRLLPLTTVTFVEGQAPLPGAWFHLSGEWKRGSSRLVYGQMIRYDPTRADLQWLVSWTSPAEQFPTWQQMTGDAKTELVVNQTLGLEPHFQVYQFAALPSPAKPVQVEEISLKESALDEKSYDHALLLARNGLWTPALKQLQALKSTHPWSSVAQAQLDLVAFHANITQAQADRDWASPRQQILALLMDGRWSEAMTVLKTAHSNGYTTTTLLADTSDRLWRRVEIALRVDPRQMDAQRWGVLFTAIRQDRNAALTWLRTQTQTTGNNLQVQDVLALLDAPSTPAVIAASDSNNSSISPITNLNRQIIGSARPQPIVDSAAWLRPNSAPLPTLAPSQTWYAIDVIQFHDGQQWQFAPFPDSFSDSFIDSSTNSPVTDNQQSTAQTIWNHLGLANDSQIEIIVGAGTQSQIIQATVHAVQLNNGTLQLLAIGEVPAGVALVSMNTVPALAMTLSTLPWVNASENLTLTTLSQQNPTWSEALLTSLWTELQQTGQALPPSVVDSDTFLREFGQWSVQLMELTGEGQPEAVLTLEITPENTPENTPSTVVSEVTVSSPFNTSTELRTQLRTQTLIFSQGGQLIYSDFRGDKTQSIQAIAELGDGNPPALIIGDARGYRVEQWSVVNQRFE